MTLRIPGRVAFLVPWPRHWLIGTTDKPYHGPVDRPAASAEDVDELLGTVNGALDIELTRDDVVGTYAGLRPLIAPSDASTTVKVSREHRVSVEGEGLVRVSGGKYTTYRLMARDAVDAVLGGTEARRRPSTTAELPILGAAARADLDALAARLAATGAASPDVATSLVDRHGTEAERVLAGGADAAWSTASRSSRPRSPGLPSTSSPCRSRTSSSGGSASPPSSATVAPRSPRAWPRSWPRSSAGTRRARRRRCRPTSTPPTASSTFRHDAAVDARRPRPRPGHHVVACHRLRPRGHAGRQRAARVPADVHVAGPRDPRPGGDLVEPARGRPRGGRAGRRRRQRRRDRHHEPARDDGGLGARDRPGRRARHRLAEPDHRPVLRPPPRRRPRALRPRAHRAPARRLLLGPQGPPHPRGGRPPRACRARRARVRHRRRLADLAPHRWARARNRRLERLADAPVRHPEARLGRRPPSA